LSQSRRFGLYYRFFLPPLPCLSIKASTSCARQLLRMEHIRTLLPWIILLLNATLGVVLVYFWDPRSRGEGLCGVLALPTNLRRHVPPRSATVLCLPCRPDLVYFAGWRAFTSCAVCKSWRVSFVFSVVDTMAMSRGKCRFLVAML
jgi:hypothetical protein